MEKLFGKGVDFILRRDACSWFQYFSQETWDRIGFVRTRKGLKIHETTITQNLLFEYQITKELFSLFNRRGWNITMLEAANERRNGNDIELFVNVNGSLMFFALQAKIINHSGFARVRLSNGNYRYIPHEVGGNYQIDLLMDYARGKGGLPLYLLYNYVNASFDKEKYCGIEFEIEQYGCSIVSAPYIKSNFYNGTAWTIPTFNDLHPDVALPWFVIPCCFMKSTISEIKEALGFDDAQGFDIKEYSLSDVMNDKDWKPLKPFNNVSSDNEETEEEEDSSRNLKTAEFLPKFRIIVSPNLD